MRRLYVQIYGTLVASLVLFGVLSWLAWMVIRPDEEEQLFLDRGAAVLATALPGPERPEAELQAALVRLTEGLHGSATVRAPDGRLLASVGRELPAPEVDERASHHFHASGGPGMAFRLPDGRWLLLQSARELGRATLLVALLLLAAAIALAAYPVVRRLTRRLEALQARVEELGRGDLSARVSVEGRDEVADLARSFNRAAARIDHLMGAQRRLLASVSHELRSPLARLRMAVELLPLEGRPELRERMGRDVTELDGLIGELLLASRLEAEPAREKASELDLLALAAEACAEDVGVRAHASGEAVRLVGSEPLLRRLVRNLLQNAGRHAGGAQVEVEVSRRAGGGGVLRVLDRGPGVAPEERDRIFEPFYRPAGAKEGGAGLGLWLVRQIAAHHGGEARWRPREGGGSCFEVTLAATPPVPPP